MVSVLTVKHKPIIQKEGSEFERYLHTSAYGSFGIWKLIIINNQTEKYKMEWRNEWEKLKVIRNEVKDNRSVLIQFFLEDTRRTLEFWTWTICVGLIWGQNILQNRYRPSKMNKSMEWEVLRDFKIYSDLWQRI